ncbi:MAG TPA: acido-empty-quinoprotein group A [Bryobacteraceae bacterium]|jgi:alcohol dehydrogenase (cytochrome c)
MNTRLIVGCLALSTTAALAQLDPAKLAQAPTDSWPTHNGDFSGRRFSPLTNINSNNVSSLSLAWVHRVNAQGNAIFGGAIKASPVVIDGVMYFTIPDHVWAVDARTGHEIWHYTWPSHGGIHIGNRGVSAYGRWLYFETPDCNLVSLNMKDGKERWHKQICDLDQMYFASAAPLVVGNHVVAGVSGDDLDIPGYIESHDPETGDRQWRWYVYPEEGSEAAKSWPSVDAMKHGGGMTWSTPTYDPALNLIYFGTGNPQPVIAGKGREGNNLYTESIVALNPDNGKFRWAFQSSPHDTHDWDAIQTPVLIDGTIDGKPRKLLAQAARNGYFFVIDRETGKNISSTKFARANWSEGLDKLGQPIPNPAKMPQPDGALVSPNQAGAANWPQPSFSPKTGLFYINATNAYSVYYIYDNDEKPEGWGGNDRGGYSESMLEGIDYQTGKVKWSHKWEGPGGPRSGVLATAGNIVFAGDMQNNFVALNSTTGEPLWHVGLNSGITNAPISYELDGTQYVVLACGDTVYAFAMFAK